MITQFPLSYFTNRYEATEKLLKKIETQLSEKNISETELFETKLAPDMFGFGPQVEMFCMSAAVMKAFDGSAFAPFVEKGSVKNFASAYEAIAQAKEVVAHLDQKDFDDLSEKMVSLPFFDEAVPVPAFMMNMIPNFEFHITTLYNIARNLGFEIGKMDFLGMGK